MTVASKPLSQMSPAEMREYRSNKYRAWRQRNLEYDSIRCKEWYRQNREAKNERLRAKTVAAGGKPAKRYWAWIIGYCESPDNVIIPPDVRERQERKIAFMKRAIMTGRVTPNQYFLGEPVKSGSVTSLSVTEICAILG